MNRDNGVNERLTKKKKNLVCTRWEWPWAGGEVYVFVIFKGLNWLNGRCHFRVHNIRVILVMTERNAKKIQNTLPPSQHTHTPVSYTHLTLPTMAVV